MPPIRDERHQKALVKGVSDGTIDFVTSDHSPIDIDNKKTDFENSLFGSTGLESIFGALNSIFKVEKSIDILTKEEKLAHKDQLEVVCAKNQMVKHVMLIMNAKVEHVVQNAVGQKDNRQAVLYATLMVIVPPVVPGIS